MTLHEGNHTTQSKSNAPHTSTASLIKLLASLESQGYLTTVARMRDKERDNDAV